MGETVDKAFPLLSYPQCVDCGEKNETVVEELDYDLYLDRGIERMVLLCKPCGKKRQLRIFGCRTGDKT